MNSSINYWARLTKLDRKSAIVARGIVQHFNSGAEDSNKLRACQEAAIAWAEEVGTTVTGTSLTSKMGRLLRDAQVFQQFEGKPKHGEGYMLEPGPRLPEFTEFLDNNLDYGMLAKGTMNELKTRDAVSAQINSTGAVMLDAGTHRVDSRTYKALRDFLNEGKLKVVYVRPDTVVAVKAKNDDRAHRVDYWMTDDGE